MRGRGAAPRQMRAWGTDFRAAQDGGKRAIEGYFAVFGTLYEGWDGEWDESVETGAFDGALDADIRALINHDARLVLGRTTAGTLTLRVDEHGLWGRTEINGDDQDALNLYARVQRRDVTQCSFGFDILDEERSIDEVTGKVHFMIRRVKLYEVSVVTFPAYEETGVEARRADCEAVRRRDVEAWRERMTRRMRGHGA